MGGEPAAATPAFLANGGQMGALIRAHDWAGTPLGPPETWPQALRTTLRLVLTARHPMFIWWGEALTCFYNDAYSALLGPDRHPSALGRPGREVWAEIWEIIGPEIDAIMAGGSATWHERHLVPITRGNRREEVWWTYSYSPIDDDASPTGVGGVLVICRDVTSEVRAEEVLRANEVRQTMLLRLMRGQRKTTDPEAMMLAAAEALGRHLGANRVGFIEIADRDTLGFGPSWTDGVLAPLSEPFPATAIGTRYLAEVRAGRTLGVADTTRDPLTANSRFGEIGARAIIGAPIFRGGRWQAGLYVNQATVRHWTEEEIALVRDLAEQTWNAVERARAVQALRVLNETLERQVTERTADRNRLWQLSTDLMLVARFDGVITAVNPACSAVLGWTEQELVDRNLFDLVHPDDRDETMSRARNFAEGGTFVRVSNRYRRKDGGYRWIAWAAVRGDGFINAVGRDVTTEREQCEALRQAEEQLRQAQKMEAIGQLTGGIAHDFNNLLTSIIGSLQLLQRRLDEGNTAGLARYCGIAVAAAQRAAALTNRLLAFARRQPLDPRPVDANRLIGSIEELLCRTLGPAIELEMVPAAGLWPAHCDPNQLESAILNLAINARDAMPEGGRLTIETANAQVNDIHAFVEGGDVRPGQFVAVSVTDTGGGMPPEVVAHVFEPFFTTKPTGQGTGLGLSMLYGFVKQSGGHIGVSSEPGRGTTMRLYLPRHHGGAEEKEEAEAPALAKIAGASAHETVLVVEDETEIRAMVAETLSDLGCRVLEAADGQNGLSLLQSLQCGPGIDLLVTDVGLPGSLNGRQLADAARAGRPGLPVLFITGYAHNPALGNGAALEPGMEMMSKPFALDALAAKVRGMIENRRSHSDFQVRP